MCNPQTTKIPSATLESEKRERDREKREKKKRVIMDEISTFDASANFNKKKFPFFC